MSILENAVKTQYKGVYRKNTKKGEAYIIRYSIKGKSTTKYVGYVSQGMSPKKAFQIRLDEISFKALHDLDEFERDFSFIPLFKKYIEFKKAYVSDNTYDNYKSIYNVYVKQDFIDIDVRDVTSINLQRYVNRILEYRLPSTVEKIIYAFTSFYKYLQDDGFGIANPASNLQLPKYDNKKYFRINKKDVKNIIKYIMSLENLIYKVIYLFLLHGRRISEVLSLKWTDIDFSNKVYSLSYTNVKSRKNQFYYLEDFQIEYLKKLKETNPGSVYLFENPKTLEPITYTSIFRVHKKLRIDLNMKDYNLHSIRHTVGYLVLNNGYSIEITSKILGHSNISSTQRYATLEMNMAQEAYSDTFGSLFKLRKTF